MKPATPQFITLETAHNGILTLSVDRSRRRKRTLAVVAQEDGTLCLQTPYRMSYRAIQEFAQTERAWIIKSALAATKKLHRPEKNTVAFLGTEYPLRFIRSKLLRKNGFCEIQGDSFHVHLPNNMTAEKEQLLAQKLMESWFRAQAGEVFQQRADFYAAQMGVRYQSIRITDPKSRWGSCDLFGNLALSWRTVMTPIKLVDYLIVHELAHIIRFDHSPAYWRVVEKIIPDYKARRKALNAAEVSLNPAHQHENEQHEQDCA